MSPHPIVHIEISSKNLEESGKFYANVFDWQVEHIPAMNYTTFVAAPGPGGGFNPVANMPAGSTIVYIDSPAER
jgi:predicted enzyme related to lactoylglutathione lyase